MCSVETSNSEVPKYLWSKLSTGPVSVVSSVISIAQYIKVIEQEAEKSLNDPQQF